MTIALIVSADTSLRPGLPRNIGDTFLTESLASALGRRGVKARIADFGLAEPTADADRLPLAGARLRGLSDAIRTADLIVVGGGTLLQDNEPAGPAIGGMARLIVTASALALVHRKPLAYLGVGANPVSRPPQRAMIQLALLGRPVWVRDEWTAITIRRLYRKKSVIAADTALFAYNPSSVPASDSGQIVLAGYPDDTAAITTALVEELRRSYGSVSFLSMSQGSRGDAAHLRPDVRAALDEVHEDVTVARAVEIACMASAIASSRMHALYLGLLMQRPLVGLGQRHKVRSFREEFSVPGIATWEALVGTAPATGDAEAIARAAARANDGLEECLRLPRRR